jgi:hypothetical protein
MRRHWTGDVWVDASLLRGEELIAEARARAARRARLRDARPPRHGVRVWLGSALLAAGHRLLRPAPTGAMRAPEA